MCNIFQDHYCIIVALQKACLGAMQLYTVILILNKAFLNGIELNSNRALLITMHCMVLNNYPI